MEHITLWNKNIQLKIKVYSVDDMEGGPKCEIMKSPHAVIYSAKKESGTT